MNNLNNQLIGSVLLILVAFTSTFVGQGAGTPQNRDTGNKADQNLRSAARVNPSTLAMEFSLPLASYPGRNGNSFPVGLSYSSKVWRMKDLLTITSGTSNISTRARPTFAERSSGGWTGTFTPPIIEEDIKRYDQTGRPYTSELDDFAANMMFEDLLTNYQNIGNSLLSASCGWYCEQSMTHYHADGTVTRSCIAYSYGCVPNYPGGSEPPEQTPIPLYYIDRLRVRTPDGATHELRKDDVVHPCGDANAPCTPVREGIYLSVDGSGIRLEKSSTGSTLYMPDGSQFTFPGTHQHIDGEGSKLYFADTHLDADGNKSTFTGIVNEDKLFIRKTDTLGRQITDFLPRNLGSTIIRSGFEQEVTLPGLSGSPQNYKLTWKRLKPIGCEDKQNDLTCGNGDGALEDQNEKLFFEAGYGCFSNAADPPLAASEALFAGNTDGIRICTALFVITSGNVLNYQRFNPQVLASIRLPNGKEYSFRYNRWGEITKIVHPTGKIERFEYADVPPLAPTTRTAYDQANRGVTKHRIDASPNEPSEYHEYTVTATAHPTNSFMISHRVNRGSSPTELGMRTERELVRGNAFGVHFGFENPSTGMPYEERTFDENNNLRSRTLTEWTIAPPRSGGDSRATRDPRVRRTISVAIENGQALAALSETEYNETGTTGNNAQTDDEYFSHLDVKRAKGYHYAVIPLSAAQSGTLAQIAAYFNQNLLAAVSETDYVYDANYKARGIRSLPVETRVLNPQNPNQIIAQTQTVYDEPSRLVADSGNLSGNLTATWSDPGTTVRGKPTTGKVWDSDHNRWIETRTQYDQYGNVRKVWEAATVATFDPARFVETEYSSDYAFAYPTKVIAPAPGDGTYGTTQGSTASTTYDFNTGLPLTATNDFGQTTATEYNDPLLRPTRTYAVNFAAPQTQTIYNDAQHWVKVRKQIDANNWDEATTFLDSFGRAVKTQSKDSQGDVFVETRYDYAGRVKATSNPYRESDIDPSTNTIRKYFSRPRYDIVGRIVESCAPIAVGSFTGNAANTTQPCQPGKSLGTTEYGISTAPGFVGSVVTTTDAAGKKGRSFTNALGQLTRVDEPNYEGNLTAIPQSSPDPDPSPTPTPEPPLDPPCSVECLSGGTYPSYSTYYKYNVQGNLVEVVQGEQHRYFKYDSLGRLIRVRQPEQQVNTSLDLPDSFNTSGKWTAKFTYDAKGNVSTATDANGTVISYTYDKASRVTTRTYSDGTPEVKYFYDGVDYANQQTPNFAKGKLTKVTSSISETRYAKFDYLGRLLESEQRTPFGNVLPAPTDAKVSKYTYNFAGALIEQEYPNGRKVKNDFGADGDLVRIYGKVNANAIERTYANSFSYTPDGRIEKLKLGNHRWEWAKFNERLQVTELNLGSGVNDASLWKLKYEYGEIDANNDVIESKNTGNIARMTTSFNGLAHPFVQSFKYDSLYRLIEARETSNSQQTWKQNFTYDRYGNRIGYENFVGTNQQTLDNKTHPSIDPQTNRFNTNQGYQYDFNGNLISDAENRQFTFNGDNKQVEIKKDNLPVGKYFYDGEGKRVKKVTNSETVIFVYDGLGKMVAEYSTKEPPQNPTTSFTATDMLGSPRVITDSNGNVTSRRDFQPFGEEILPNGVNRTVTQKYGSADGIRQKFTTYQRDEETLLDFAEARMYENRHARFTAVDPLLASGKSANPQTFNRYVYVMNNPVRNTDPTGLQTATDPEAEEGEIWVYINWFRDTFSNYRSGTANNSLLNRVSSSDPLQNANYQTFKNTIDATAGNQDAIEALNETVLPGNGPTTTSILQGYTDAYKRAETVGNWGLFLQNLTFTAAGMVGSNGSSLATNRGFSISGRGTSGFSIYAKRDAFIRTEVAVDDFLAQNPTAKPSVVIGAADVQSTAKVAMTEGSQTFWGTGMRNLANRLFGGTGMRVNGNVVGCCAEQRAANFLETRFGTKPENVVFSNPFRPRTGEFVPVCDNCQLFFRPDQFANGTSFRKNQ